MAASHKRWKESLDRLECPFTEGLSDEEVNNLLLNESEERLELLEWLLLLYQPRLIEVLDSTAVRKGRVTKSKIERILKAVNTLSLCHAEDVDLIKGVAPVNKQRLFINSLIELVLYKTSQQLISPSEASSYIDKLADEGIFCDIDEKIGLLPKDIKAEVESLYQGSGQPPPLEELRTSYQECVKEVEKLEGELTELQKHVTIQTLDQQREVTAMNQMLSSSIQDLDQLAVGFLHSFESHIGAWCHQQQPELNDLGPSAKRVHTQLKKFVPFLEDINKLRQLRCDLEENIKENRTRKIVDAISTDSSSSDNIQRCLGILEESMHRTESGFKSRYSNLLHL